MRCFFETINVEEMIDVEEFVGDNSLGTIN